MNRRQLIVLVLIVLLPLAAIAWLTVRVARGERETLRRRFEELQVVRLRDYDGVIQELLAEHERRLMSEGDLAGLTPEQLRERVRRSALVRQYFVMDEQGELLYPAAADVVRRYFSMEEEPRPGVAARMFSILDQNSLAPYGNLEIAREYFMWSKDGAALQPAPSGPLSSAEGEFLMRTHEIWANRLVPNIRNATVSMGDNDVTPDAQTRRAAMPAKGWYVWYWGEGLDLIFWWRVPNGRVVGAEIRPERLLADAVGVLPDTNPDDPAMVRERIVLRDDKDCCLYQWGGYVPDEKEGPRVVLPLSMPLATWNLAYYGPATLPNGWVSASLFNVFAGLILIAVAVIGMAVYYYLASSREVREAARRITFVNQVAHELKTPLTSIRMYAEMLDEELEDREPGGSRSLRVIVDESKRLSRLIANILTFSRGQRKALRLNTSPGVVDEAIRDVLDLFLQALGARGIAVRFSPGAPRRVLFDRDVIEQILGNLLSNVEKYAVGADAVNVTSLQEGARVVITVADNGPGVPARDRQKIFRPFYRVSNKSTDGVAGTGIGLSIARDLARLHGGTLTLEPGGPGARFRFEIRAPDAEEEG